jgi:hypothetical protein
MVLGGWLAVAIGAASVQGGEFFVAPEGTAQGDGSKEKPWDLATAVGHPPAVKPGDTIWLRGGTYLGGRTCRLAGEKDKPIVVRQFPGERAKIDCLRQGEKTGTLFVMGDWVRFQDFEVTCSDPKRTTKIVSSWPVDLDRGSIDCRGSHVSFVNLIVHDLGVGIGFWSEGEGGEIYGCVIYNNGWRAPDRGHGHGIYTQNERGTKRIVDNVIFNQFAYGLHAYGSSKAKLEGFHIEGNATFNNGCLAGEGERAANILVGGGTRAARIAAISNFTYHSGLAGTSTQFGYGATNDDLVLRDNYFAGFVRMLPWERLTARGNTFVGLTSLVELRAPSFEALKKYEWDGNKYLSAEVQYSPLAVVTEKADVANGWKEWQEKAGIDRSGEYVKGQPKGTAVFVRPNQYQRGRAHLVIYNWDKLPAVEIDLSAVLAKGQKYRIVSAQNIFAEPVLQGVYDGQAVKLPMKATPAAQPEGLPEYKLPVTEPEFGVYILLGWQNAPN